MSVLTIETPEPRRPSRNVHLELTEHEAQVLIYALSYFQRRAREPERLATITKLLTITRGRLEEAR